MLKFAKALGTLAIFAVLLIILERWYNIFFLGRLFESVGMGMAIIGFLGPVVAVIGAVWLIIQLWKAK